MGRADGLASSQDPRRLPRLPRRYPLQRKRFTADMMSTGEPDATETGTSGSGRGRRKRSSNPSHLAGDLLHGTSGSEGGRAEKDPPTSGHLAARTTLPGPSSRPSAGPPP